MHGLAWSLYTSIKVARGHNESVEDCLYLGDQVGDGVLLLVTGGSGLRSTPPKKIPYQN